MRWEGLVDVGRGYGNTVNLSKKENKSHDVDVIIAYLHCFSSYQMLRKIMNPITHTAIYIYMYNCVFTTVILTLVLLFILSH